MAILTFKKRRANAGEFTLKFSHDILLDGKRCGFYGLNDENQFEIWFYVECEDGQGFAPVCLSQTETSEEKCRTWLQDNVSRVVNSSLKLYLLP